MFTDHLPFGGLLGTLADLLSYTMLIKIRYLHRRGINMSKVAEYDDFHVCGNLIEFHTKWIHVIFKAEKSFDYIWNKSEAELRGSKYSKSGVREKMKYIIHIPPSSLHLARVLGVCVCVSYLFGSGFGRHPHYAMHTETCRNGPGIKVRPGKQWRDTPQT